MAGGLGPPVELTPTAPSAAQSTERRASGRQLPAATGWSARATLRPGHEVTLLDLGGAAVSISTRVALRPGKRIDLQLRRDGQRHELTGRVVRCQLVSLTPPSYHAAVLFDTALPADLVT